MPSEVSSRLSDRAAVSWRDFQSSKLYDFFAAAPMFLWYSVTAGNLIKALVEKFESVPAATIDLHFAVAAMGQAAAIVFVLMVLSFVLLRRPAGAKAKGIIPRLSAVAGTYLGISLVWLPVQQLSLSLSLLSLALILGGVGFSIYSLWHLGRSFSLMAEARQLVTNGPYRYVRHPLYVGEAVSMLGLVLQYWSLLAVAILAVQFAFQLQRICNEERVLAGLFPHYETYRTKTARLLPGIY